MGSAASGGRTETSGIKARGLTHRTNDTLDLDFENDSVPVKVILDESVKHVKP